MPALQLSGPECWFRVVLNLDLKASDERRRRYGPLTAAALTLLTHSITRTTAASACTQLSSPLPHPVVCHLTHAPTPCQ